MRSHGKLVLVALVVVLVLSALASASASASFNKEFVIEGGKLPQAITGSDNEHGMRWYAQGNLSGECANASITGTLEAGGLSKSTVSYSHCHTEEGCYIHEPFVLHRNGHLVETNGALVQKYAGSEVNEQMGIMWISRREGYSYCYSSGKYSIHGSEECELPEIGAFQEMHVIACVPNNENNLRMGEIGRGIAFVAREDVSTAKGVRYKAD